MAELTFFTGTMAAGKSSLALQMDYDRRTKGQNGVLLTSKSREGSGLIVSRLGVSRKATELRAMDGVLDRLEEASPSADIDYVICDEAQFYTVEQIESLAHVADYWFVPVFCFGITADFQSRLFPGSKRLLELADRIEILQLSVTCWCGVRGTHNARVVSGKVVYDGDQVMVGDVGHEVGYAVLCRKHWREGRLAW